MKKFIIYVLIFALFVGAGFGIVRSSTVDKEDITSTVITTLAEPEPVGFNLTGKDITTLEHGTYGYIVVDDFVYYGEVINMSSDEYGEKYPQYDPRQGAGLLIACNSMSEYGIIETGESQGSVSINLTSIIRGFTVFRLEDMDDPSVLVVDVNGVERVCVFVVSLIGSNASMADEFCRFYPEFVQYGYYIFDEYPADPGGELPGASDSAVTTTGIVVDVPAPEGPSAG